MPQETLTARDSPPILPLNEVKREVGGRLQHRNWLEGHDTTWLARHLRCHRGLNLGSHISALLRERRFIYDNDTCRPS